MTTDPTPIRTVFLGTGEIGLPSLEALIAHPLIQVVGVVTQPDRAAGRSLKLTPPPIKVRAHQLGLPVFQPDRLRAADAIAGLAALNPDLFVVMAYGQILPRAALDLPRLACLNLHASILPRHRGAAPIQAAIQAGDAETGVAVMHMAEGLDTGDVCLVKKIPIRRRETGGLLHDRLADLAPIALREAIDLLAAGKLSRTPQNDAEATYAPRLDRSSGVLDWQQNACAVERRIRAMNPWPAASSLVPLAAGGEARLKVFSAIVCRKVHGPAGSILRADSRGLLVACGSGAVLLREVQPEGKRRMPAGAWLAGHAVKF